MKRAHTGAPTKMSAATKDALEALLKLVPFRAFAPYQTFSKPNSKAFKDSDGAQIVIDSPDVDALFAMGHEAYAQMIATCVPGVLERYADHRRDVLELRRFLKEGVYDDKGESIFNYPAHEGEESIKKLRRKPQKEITLLDACRVLDHLFECFGQIDKALVCIQHPAPGAITASIAAARQLEEAAAIFRSVEAIKDVLSSTASKAATARHNKANKDLQLVIDCYTEWKHKRPKRYDSVAEFARDMIHKCAKVKDPRTVEKWVRDWREKNER
jgi:hypothetical protein